MVHRQARTVRFVRANIEPLPEEHCRAVVEIERPENGVHQASAEGGPAQSDGLRTVARATADAVSAAFSQDGVRVRVRGVQTVEAFGQTVTIVSVATSLEGRTHTLLGICNAGDNTPRAAALAVLNATNRVLGSP